MLVTISIQVSIPREGSASQETGRDFNVSTVPGIPYSTPQNSAQFGAPRSTPGYCHSPTTGILSGAQGWLILWLNESKKPNEEITGFTSLRGTAGDCEAQRPSL